MQALGNHYRLGHKFTSFDPRLTQTIVKLENRGLIHYHQGDYQMWVVWFTEEGKKRWLDPDYRKKFEITNDTECVDAQLAIKKYLKGRKS